MDVTTIALRLFQSQAQILKAINGSAIYGHERLMAMLSTGVKLADWMEHDAGGMLALDQSAEVRRSLRQSIEMTSENLEWIRETLRANGRWALPDGDFMRKLMADIDSVWTFPSPAVNPDMEVLFRLVWAQALTVEKLDHLARALQSDQQGERKHLVLTAFQMAECIEGNCRRELEGASLGDQKRIWAVSIDALRDVYARKVPTLREGPGGTPSDADLILMLADCVRETTGASA
ncbi:hypothetical protein [Paraburkholderia aromaticivorans]|uniref:Uncharacterized protein n=1 Tax=Paraburkholderia aromaticivorans TaxID=2026199 RepID=A0A248VYS8_9BURK|nr:hypothetical protein [Paraburkholderia aromaticivorans]ASW03682.1 hypothetical protein CJU94_36390 [Paraburkholderia aromaticivorans]